MKEHAWFKANAEDKTHPVGQKSPNAWGLFDMHGNVWEWCQDWWGGRYYATSQMDDPPGVSAGSNQVFRGGSWAGDGFYGRVSFRGGNDSSRRHEDHGFRVARIVSSPP